MEKTITKKISKRNYKGNWEEFWRKVTSPDRHDITSVQYMAQFRADIQASTWDTYLCVHGDKSVWIDGKGDNSNTFFQVTHDVNLNYYQITTTKEPVLILFVENNHMKARDFNKNKDCMFGNNPRQVPEETLFEFKDDSDSNVYIESKVSNFAVVTDAGTIMADTSENNISFDLTVIERETTV